jgi:integrase/recombinase XerC
MQPRRGVKNVTPHSYRHTVTTQLARNPAVDIVTAAAFMGHSRIDTTARYAKLSDDDLARAAEQI